MSSIKDASYVTKIDSSTIKQCIKDPAYRDFINYFMLPRNCFNLITILNDSATHEFMAFESIFGLCDADNQLYQIIRSKFTTYYFISTLEKMSCKDFKEYLLLELKSDMFNFDPTINSYKKINIYECLTSDMCTKLKNSITTLTSAYEIFEQFISYIANITCESLYKCELDKINRTKVASEFNKLIFEYLDT